MSSQEEADASLGPSGCDSCTAQDDLHWSAPHGAWFCDGCYVRENMTAEGPTDAPLSVPAVGGDKEHDDQCEAVAPNMSIMSSLCGCWARANFPAPSPSVPPAAPECICKPSHRSDDPICRWVPPAATDETPLRQGFPVGWVTGESRCDCLTDACNCEASPVPAATADEAALAVIARLDSVHDDKCEAEFIEGAFAYTGCDCPRRLVAALHAQGYRIVQDQR